LWGYAECEIGENKHEVFREYQGVRRKEENKCKALKN
jgi:hypothetical protein